MVRANEGVSTISHISFVCPSVPGIRLPQTDPLQAHYMLTERLVRTHSIEVTVAKSFPSLENTVTVYGSFYLSYGGGGVSSLVLSGFSLQKLVFLSHSSLLCFVSATTGPGEHSQQDRSLWKWKLPGAHQF